MTTFPFSFSSAKVESPLYTCRNVKPGAFLPMRSYWSSKDGQIVDERLEARRNSISSPFAVEPTGAFFWWSARAVSHFVQVRIENGAAFIDAFRIQFFPGHAFHQGERLIRRTERQSIQLIHEHAHGGLRVVRRGVPSARLEDWLKRYSRSLVSGGRATRYSFIWASARAYLFPSISMSISSFQAADAYLSLPLRRLSKARRAFCSRPDQLRSCPYRSSSSIGRAGAEGAAGLGKSAQGQGQVRIRCLGRASRHGYRWKRVRARRSPVQEYGGGKDTSDLLYLFRSRSSSLTELVRRGEQPQAAMRVLMDELNALPFMRRIVVLLGGKRGQGRIGCGTRR